MDYATASQVEIAKALGINVSEMTVREAWHAIHCAKLRAGSVNTQKLTSEGYAPGKKVQQPWGGEICEILRLVQPTKSGSVSATFKGKKGCFTLMDREGRVYWNLIPE